MSEQCPACGLSYPPGYTCHCDPIKWAHETREPQRQDYVDNIDLGWLKTVAFVVVVFFASYGVKCALGGTR